MKKTPEPTPPRPKQIFAFIGECNLTSGKRGIKFLQLTKEQYETGVVAEPPALRFFEKKGMHVGQPGSCYEYDFESKEDGSCTIYPDSRQYLGRWPNDEDCLRWELENRLLINKRDAIALEKKESTKSLIVETLKPLRELYQHTVHSQRQALIALIVYQLTKGGAS